VGEGEEEEVGHQLQREEGEGVQRRMPSISSGLSHIR